MGKQDKLREPLLPPRDGQQKPKFIERVFTKSYLLLAGLCGIFFGTNAFLIEGTVKEVDTYRVFCCTGFGMVAYYLGYHLI